MSIPALTKTYHTHGNVPLSSTSTLTLAYQSVWWALKALLTNQSGIGGEQSGTRSAGSIWTHVASCDGVSVSTVTDLWGSTFDASKLVSNASGSAHSWWKGTNGTHDILLDMNSSTVSTGRIGMAPSGAFSAGSTTAGPIVASDWYAGNATSNSASATAAYFADANMAGAKVYAHLVTNSSDHSFQFHVSRAGTGIFSCLLSLQVTSGAADSYNRFFLASNTASGRGAPGQSAVSGASGCTGRVRNNTAHKTAGGLTAVTCAGLSVSSYTRDSLTGLYWAEPVEVRDLTLTHVAKRGVIADWLGIGAAAVGLQVDGAGAERRVIGDFLMPFPGVTPII